MMTAITDLPPAYNSLEKDPEAIEEGVPNSEDEAELLVNDAFQDKTKRIGFIQKVLTIILLQALAVCAVIIFVEIDYWRLLHSYYRYSNVNYLVLSSLALAFTWGVLLYCDKARYKNPYRYIFLVVCTLSFGFFIALMMDYCFSFDPFIPVLVYYCLALFGILAYSIFALNTNIEFVAGRGIMVAAGVQFVMFCLTAPFFYYNGFYVLYPTLASSIGYIYLLWDLKLMTSKNYRTAITPDDFVDGAINIHVDFFYHITNIILPILRQLCEKFKECCKMDD